MKYRFKVVLLLLVLPTLVSSCGKFLEVEAPSTAVDAVKFYKDGPAAATALTGIYSSMVTGIHSSYYTALLSGLLVDELKNAPPHVADFYLNNVLPSSTINTDYWNIAYKNIYNANAIYEGCSISPSQSPEVKKQLMGEALFIRAYHYFYLVNFYGNVPLVLTTEVDKNEHIKRTDKAVIYEQMVQDLQAASNDLSPDYLGEDLLPTHERVRPCKAVANALLARVYLYTEKWAEAEHTATEIINNSQVYALVRTQDVFLKNSQEAIWQLMLPPDNDFALNTKEADEFMSLPQAGKPYKPLLTEHLMAAFEEGDLRRTHWVGSITDSTTGELVYFPYKYKVPKGQPISEYTMVFRLAEQYLIRAEARLHLGNYQGALEDINVVRKRAGLCERSGTDTLLNFDSLHVLILQERRVELFTEQGHRWFDTKRTHNIENVMGKVISSKGAIWRAGRDLLPMPEHEMRRNDLLEQNPGY